MDKRQLVCLLCELNKEKFAEHENPEELFRKKSQQTLETLSCTFDDVSQRIQSITKNYNGDSISEWHYVCLNFYILETLNQELSKSHLEVLSVQEVKDVKSALSNLMLHEILQKIQRNLPHHVQFDSKNDIITDYNLLKCTTLGFISIIKHPELRMLVVPHLLQGILVSCIQIAFCPLKKPTTSPVMSETTYSKLLKDQDMFKLVLEDLRRNIHPAFFVKEIMSLFHANAPQWFKKAISSILTKLIRSKKGVECIASAMLDGHDDDNQNWKILEVLSKLILSCRQFPDFASNISVQVLQLLDVAKTHNLMVFERVVISCTKRLYSEDENLCKTVFLPRITEPFSRFVNKERDFDDDVTEEVKQSVRLMHVLFLDDLPIELLRDYINTLFHFYHLTGKSPLQTTHKELKELLEKYLSTLNQLDPVFDSFLFGIPSMTGLRDDVTIEISERITVKASEHTVIHATADVVDTLFQLLCTGQKVALFGYLLGCLTKKEQYFSSGSRELLNEEDQSMAINRLLTVHRLLAQLAEDEQVQRSIKDKPGVIIDYVNAVLTSNAGDSEMIFTILMIVDSLVANATPEGLQQYKILLDPLSKITGTSELRDICNKISTAIRHRRVSEAKGEPTEFDKALEDICDPLLPVRGHGLLVLAQLVEKKDEQAMERKMYLLNLFQMYLKDEDSFIYLNAVRGLAALGDAFPDRVLEVLCEEYSDFKKTGEEALRTRMKLGEVLVRVVSSLGETAPKHKALLLNTFLSGTKDDDHLLRASSLANLGEVCRVLNYKLGTIVTEILVCVHAVIATDKAVEARRAAVAVIRLLFVGLSTETVSFLRDEILQIYRTLKEIYHNDKDDVMRLQAQLALEELNENVRNFLFPRLEVNKKFVLPE